MKIWKEVKRLPVCDDEPDDISSVIRLENDVLLIELKNCTARGTDGQRYVTVSKEVISPVIPTKMKYVNISIPDDKIPPDDPYDTDLEYLGWTTEADVPVVIELDLSEIQTGS